MNNIIWHNHHISKEQRSTQKAQKPCLIWFTGLSGSGKSTIAGALEEELFKLNKHTYLLDGDNVRHGLNKDLGFSDQDRIENIRRIGEMAKLFVDAGIITLSAFISPFHSERQLVRSLVQEFEFIEVYISTPLNECEKRDPKGLYQKARKGEIQNFTGISSEYEPPLKPEIIIDTSKNMLADSVDIIISYLKEHNYIS